MKITKRQLRRIISEAINTDTLKLADLVRAVDYEGDGWGGDYKKTVGHQVGTVIEIDEDPDYPTQYTVLFPDGTTIMDDLGPPGEQRFELVSEGKMKITRSQLIQIIKEEIQSLSEFDKKRMKCNKKRFLRKGETGYGNQQKVVKACDDSKEKIVKFGSAKMRNNKDKPKNRKSFRARMKCDTPGSKLKARYWACKDW